jgi:nicotinamide mononucleotide (NMN) deamidase PncC
MDPTTQALIAAIHQSDARWVLGLTGGGSQAAAQLLSVPGASRAILEVLVPYHPHALVEFLGHPPAQFCSADTSREMAERAQERARWLAPGEKTFGLGCTASLASDRPKRGEHRIFVSVAGGDEVRTWSLVLSKGARERAGEEAIAAALVLHAMATSLGLSALPPLPLLEDESLAAPTAIAAPWQASAGTALFFSEDGQFQPAAVWQPDRPMTLGPGAFNPLHGGHVRLVEAAGRLTGLPVAFEMSVTNVDKPDLTTPEIRRRLGQFAGHAAVWLTSLPRFVDKALFFPGAIFAIGADTAVRLFDPRYYDRGLEGMLAAFAFLRDRGCRFLVAGRADASGEWLGLENLPLPPGLCDLFCAIPPQVFRLDISSTLLRARTEPPSSSGERGQG